MMQYGRSSPIRPARRTVGTVLAARAGSWWQKRLVKWRIRRTVETLSALDDRTLADIGLRRDDIVSSVRERSSRW